MTRPRILVFSPHPEDVIVGCGGFLALARSNNSPVKIIVITDGDLNDQSLKFRRNECNVSLEVLGVDDVDFWGYPTQTIPLSGQIIKNYLSVVSEFTPDFILLPSPSDTNPDNRRVTRGILKAIESTWSGDLLFFETTQPVVINTIKDITPVFDLKRIALRAYTSQKETHTYEEYCASLAKLRGLSIAKDFGEGFLSHSWDGSKQNFFETLPLVSVIMRADNLLFLRHALYSLKNQNYDHIEIILVWHGTEEPDIGEFDYLDLHLVRGKSNRGYNFNIGLSLAQGEYIAFLDQDDIMYPHHLELLLSHIHGNNDCDIVYSGCKASHCEIRGENIVLVREEKVFNNPYEPGRLILENYMPIHTLLFRKTIFHTQMFDETLSAYEDWEMLTRLEIAGYRFLHVNSISCEYRLFGNSDIKTISQLHDKKGYQSQKAFVLSKILDNVKVRNIEQLATLFFTYESRAHELEEIVDAQRKEIDNERQKYTEYETHEKLLSQCMHAANIEHHGQKGLSALIGQILSKDKLFSIILPVYNTDSNILKETLDSINNQIYSGWELCIVDDASDKVATKELLSRLYKNDSYDRKLHYVQHKEREGITKSLNDAVAMAQMPYLVFLDHDDLLHEEALLTLAMVLKTEKMYSLLYTDSRTVDPTGKPMNISRKPKWSPDNLLHGNYINHMTVVRRDLFEKFGGFRQDFEGSQDLDLLLRLSKLVNNDDVRHINKPLYDWRALPESLAYSSIAKPFAFESARKAIAHYLHKEGLQNVRVDKNPHGRGFCCHWQHPNKEIEIIIPTKDNLVGLNKCIDGLLNSTYYYPGFSITIISNNSSSSDLLHYLDTLYENKRVKIITDNRPFNWSVLNNRAVAESSSPIILFLNDDVEIIDNNWLINMSKYLLLHGVGAVGATLFYPDGSLQHNGIQTDEEFVAANITTWGTKKELTNTRNVSAVTGACLLLERKTFELASGLDENFPRSYNDVDLCLQIRKKGLRIVQARDVQLIHHEAVSCGFLENPQKREEWGHSSSLMKKKWGQYLQERYMASYEIFSLFTKVLHVKK